MDILYGVRFNGVKLDLYKYSIISNTDGIMELLNITKGTNLLATHQNDRIAETETGRLREQYNAYIVYISDLNQIQDAVYIIAQKVADDKAVYEEAVKTRLNEFNVQLETIENTDISSLIEKADAV